MTENEPKFEIRLIKHSEMNSIVPLVSQLNHHNIDTQTLTNRLTEMLARGYQCVGVFEGKDLVGVAGLWLLTKFYVGNHLEIDNVVVAENYQNKGIGDLMMTWIEAYAKQNNCLAIELNCYIGNEKAHKFWFNKKGKILGFHFQIKLLTPDNQ